MAPQGPNKWIGGRPESCIFPPSSATNRGEEATKNGLPHTVPLTPSVVAIINWLPCFDSVFVFPARGNDNRPYSGYSKGEHALCCSKAS
jgi:hypothetical protein